jgi:hypothetical protein
MLQEVLFQKQIESVLLQQDFERELGIILNDNKRLLSFEKSCFASIQGAAHSAIFVPLKTTMGEPSAINAESGGF